jgi:L-ribulokinase
MGNEYVIGVDYGTDSVRSIIVDARNGNEIATSVFFYPRWKQGLYCDAANNQFRQHPLDYVEGLEYTIKDCLHKAGESVAQNIKAISIDTTGSTPIAVDGTGTPLSLLPAFENNPNAMFVLWKDHKATKEAEQINIHAAKFETNYLQFVGGIYSSEWFWAKLLFVLREDEAVRKNIHSFVEHCDWIPFILTGGNDATKIKRGVCSAGHKALWAAEFGGLPPNNFFATLDPLLDGITDKLFTETLTADKAAGTISNEWAQKLGLPNDVIIGVGAFDCHMGAVGGQIEPYYLSKVMGTSTCDMMVAPIEDVKDNLVKGICGQVNGSIIPNMIGLEAGQSAFGDLYAWFKNLIAWPIHVFVDDENEREKITNKLIATLAVEAERIPLKDDDEIAIDWMNGRRTPDANQSLKGAIANINLGSDAPRIFKSLVEATCFGSKAIVNRFIEEGIAVKGIIALGGVAKKSNYVMQTMANVLNMPIRVHRSEQTCAIGAAMFAATAAGIYEKVEDAMIAMGQGFEKTYEPQNDKVSYYEKRYKMYQAWCTKIENNE